MITPDGSVIAPPPQTLNATSSSRPIAYNITVQVSTPSGGSWLQISTNQGSTPGTVQVSVNPSGLAQSIYDGSVLFTPTEAGVNAVAVPVRLVNCGQSGCGIAPPQAPVILSLVLMLQRYRAVELELLTSSTVGLLIPVTTKPLNISRVAFCFRPAFFRLLTAPYMDRVMGVPSCIPAEAERAGIVLLPFG